MFKKPPPPRGQIITIRTSDERYALLERYQEALTQRLGRPVTIAEAAFLMMEERAPEVERQTAMMELQQTPTASLARVRARWQAERALSAAEWDLLATYVQIGAEEERNVPPLLQPAVPARTSYLALVDAFEAVYRERAKPNSKHAWVYFSNLDGHHAGLQLSDRPDDAAQRDQALLQLLALRRERLSTTADAWEYPGNIGRCLMLAIRDEGVPAPRLDQLLAPYWSVLWGVAARAHWLRHDRQPVRLGGPHDEDLRQRFTLPEPLTADAFTVSFASAGPELAAQITLRDRQVTIVIDSYPALADFRAMLDAPPERSWHGRYFRAIVSRDPAQPGRTIWLSRTICVDLSPSEWTALAAVCREAWGHSDVQRWLDELAQEYGEQG